MSRSSILKPLSLFAVILLLGGIITATVAFQSVSVDEIDIEGTNLTSEEEAYFEYVAPRLETIVIEVEATREMVETKSRDILALGRAGTIIETLTAEIQTYGNDNGVPAKFGEIHEHILNASVTVNATFEEARTALRTFNFSRMSGLVDAFGLAADEFSKAYQDLTALVPNADVDAT